MYASIIFSWTQKLERQYSYNGARTVIRDSRHRILYKLASKRVDNIRYNGAKMRFMATIPLSETESWRNTVNG